MTTRLHKDCLGGIFLIPTLVIQAWSLKYTHVTLRWWRSSLDIWSHLPWEDDPNNPVSRFSHKP